MMPGHLATRSLLAPPAAGVRRNRHAERDAGAFPTQIGATVTLCFHVEEPIFYDGDNADYFYVLAEGVARLCKVRANGRRQIVRLVLPGELFGFEVGTKHKLTADALSNVVVRRYPRSFMERFDNAGSDTGRMVMALLYRERATAQHHLFMIGHRSAKERVASFLLLLHASKGIGVGKILDLPFGREDFADYLGLTTETVSRVLTELRRAGSIKFLKNPRQIMFRDLDTLRALADGYGI